jgi:predicted enzyme related to lactoylglutathione lyase
MPTYGNGKVCYIEIPAVDATAAAEFYRAVFGWQTRRRGDGALAFDDAVGEVSGAFTTARAPVAAVGLLVYIMVDDIEATLKAIAVHGGRLVQPVGADAPEITARFSDPAGNVFGLYQQPG